MTSRPPSPTDKESQQVNQSLEQNAETIRTIVTSINAAQMHESNLAQLQSDKVGNIAGLAKLLHTDTESGIDLKTVATRKALFGENHLPSTPRKSFWQLFVGSFEDATLQILIVAALVSLAIGIYDDPATGYVEGCAILAAVLVVSVVTSANDYQKESQFRELSAANDAVDVVVQRGGLHWQISVHEIVVGDIVCLEAGDQIPCDGVLLQADAMQVDESALTGEPVDVDKDLKNDPFVLSGCTVEAGHGKFIAIAVGKDSQWGIIKSHLEKEQEATPLQEKLDDMAAMIGYVGMGAAGATFLAMMFIKIVLNPDYLSDISIFHYALEAFIIGVTIVVVAVPEGLPLAVTISLAFSTKKMLADQNLIRHLAACETMGNATNICSDKTGTLTENRMTVVKGMFADTRCDDTINRVPVLINRRALNIILEGIACCSTARVIPPQVEEGKIADERPHIIGNKTEAALLLLAQSGWTPNDDTEARRKKANFGKEGGSRMFPFSSARKRMSVLVLYEPEVPLDSEKRVTRSSMKLAQPSWTLYHKGAAEVVLKDCTHYLEIDGSEQPLTDKKRKEFEQVVREFASEALRCVALCHRNDIHNLCDPNNVSADDVQKKLENKLCLDAIAGIMDPLRPDVIDAVSICQKAGIFVRMVTGDSLDTAEAIARKAGILTKGE
jgi:P-type Ca2+ transporter type 2C